MESSNNKESSSSRHRKKWNTPQNLEFPKEAAAVKEEVCPQYEQYLLLLQQRNRMLHKLKTKSSQEIELERKEQGFTLYMNGANATLLPAGVNPQPPSADRIPNHEGHSRRHLAIARLVTRQNKNLIDHQHLKILEHDLERTIKNREAARTAPLNKRRRKRWNLKSLNIKLAGVSDSVNSAESYNDDFESDQSSDEQSSDDDWVGTASPHEDNGILAPQPPSNSKPENNYSRSHYSPRRQKLTLSIADIKKLKESLEANPLVQQSVAEELNSSEESDIPEEFNEINEDYPNCGSQDLDSNLFKPGDHVVLEFGLPAKKSERKILSIARKNSEHFSDGSSGIESIETASIHAAIQSENSQLSDRSLSNCPVDSRIQQQQQQQQTPEQPFPAVISPRSEALTEQNISSITNNVLQMKPRQQINLIKRLGKLEESMNDVLSGQQDETNKETSCPRNLTNMCVQLELMTNWGHDKRIGLTEIQLYQKDGKIIPIQPEDISVKNSINKSGSIHTLFNGKTKTSKIKNMWSCDFNPDCPVIITINPKNTQQAKEFSLAKIKIWNYNHNIKELNTGVKRIKISVGEELLHDADLEKGCGNHIFANGTTINVSTSVPSQVNNNISPLSKRSSTESDLYNASNSRPQLSRKASLTQTTPPLMSPVLSESQPKNGAQNAPLLFDDYLKDAQGLNLPLPPLKNLTPRNREHSSDNLSRESSSDSLLSGKHGHTNKESPRAKRMEIEAGGLGRKNLDKTKSLKHEETEFLPDIFDFQSLSPRTLSQRKDSGTTLLDKVLISPDSPSSLSDKLNKNKSSLDWLEEDDDIFRQLSENCEIRPERSRLRSVQRCNSQLTERMVPNLGDKSRHEPLENFDRSPSAKDKTGQLLDQRQGSDSFEISLQPTLKLRNRQSKPDPHLRPRLKRDTSGVSSPSSATSPPLHTILDDDFPEKTVEPEMEDQFNMDINEDDPGRCTPLEKIKKKRARWRGHSDNKLEEYWGSLNYFNHLHRGRLSMDGDILDEYLNETKANPLQTEPAFSPLPEIPVMPSQEKQGSKSSSTDDFIIPELPCGQELVINIRTTWGDKHYVGLTGIDIFSKKGDSVVVKKITADPKDINILPEYDKDPRVVQNLIDGVNRTRDDVHMWLTPFTSGGNHRVTLTFAQPCCIALIRIWNYNKSRIHSFRGVRDVDITLDGKMIFKGEIARACGGIEGGTESFGDTILFSVEEEILEAVSRNDEAYEGDALEDISWEDNLDIDRPNTATIADSAGGDRPFTRACGVINEEELKALSALSLMDAVEKEAVFLKGKHLKLNFTQTWGDLHYLGLTSLEVFGVDGQAIPLNMNMITAEPQDLHCLPGHERDDRTLDKLIDGNNVTISDEHMWLVPFTPGKPHLVNIEFPQPITISGIRIWNYNKNQEDTYRGLGGIFAKAYHLWNTILQDYFGADYHIVIFKYNLNRYLS